MSSLLEDSVPQRNQTAAPATVGPRTGSFGRTVAGVHTDLVVTKYDNATLIVVTQLRKFGTVLQITSERARNTQLDGGSRIVYSVSTLLGKDSEELHLFGRVLAERLELQQPLILTAGFKHFKEDNIRPLIDFILEKFKTV